AFAGVLYETIETPFASHVTVPVASLGGHVQLAGYFCVQSSENYLMGLPGAGSLPAHSVSGLSHPGISAPPVDESYGFNVSFRIHAAATRDLGGQALHVISRFFACVRGI
ncbi:MAG: hypothetical protein ACRD5L_06700, partial [Bryobacteraceae bacterium]